MLRILLETMATLLIGLVCAASAMAPPVEQRNLAIGKPYTLSPAPTYALCTDQGDATDLTDGKIQTRNDTFLWTEMGCVGWVPFGRPVLVTVDLGQVEPISGAAFYSAARRASSVYYPGSIDVQISEDGKIFHRVGDLAELSPAPQEGEYSLHTFSTDQLRTKGRYVRFVIVNDPYLFCDEVEVYRGPDSLLNQPIGGEIVSQTQPQNMLRLLRLGVQRRLALDLAQVRSDIEKQASGKVKEQFLEELNDLQKRAATEKYPTSVDGFRAIVPVGGLDRQILGVYGKLLASEGVAPLTLWHTPPYQLLPVLQKPAGSLKQLTVQMMENEHRAEAFNLTNASGEATTAHFSIEGLPAASMRVYQVECVDTSQGIPVSSALVPLEAAQGQYTVSISAGMTRQVWLAFDSKDVPSGLYNGQIRISSGALDSVVDLSLSVASVRMADEPALSTGMWDYIFDEAYGITPGNKDAAAKDMSSHMITDVWCQGGVAPQPNAGDFDASGNLVGNIDYAKWDAFVKFWPGMRHYFAFCSIAPGKLFAGLKPGTPACDRAISQWAADWADHNGKIGLNDKQAFVLFVDEPRTPAKYQLTREMVKPFKEGTHQIGVFIDPVIHGTDEFKQYWNILKLCDMVMPTRNQYIADGPPVWELYRQLREDGTPLGLYMCSGPIRQFDPAYYRMQPWHCFAIGAVASGFWSYGGNVHENSWNEYANYNALSYTPVYLWSDGVCSSKDWEALREGIEDYQYLKMLADRVGEDKTQQLAQAVVEDVIKQYSPDYAQTGWHDVSRFTEEARLRVLRELTKSAPAADQEVHRENH